MILTEIWFSWETHKSSCTGFWGARGWGHWNWHAAVPNRDRNSLWFSLQSLTTAISRLSGSQIDCAVGAQLSLLALYESRKKTVAFTWRCALPCLCYRSFPITSSFEALSTYVALNRTSKKHKTTLPLTMQVELTYKSSRHCGLRAFLQMWSLWLNIWKYCSKVSGA